MTGFCVAITAFVGVLIGGIQAVTIGATSVIQLRSLQRTTLQHLCQCPPPSPDQFSPIPQPVTSAACCSSAAPIPSPLR